MDSILASAIVEINEKYKNKVEFEQKYIDKDPSNIQYYKESHKLIIAPWIQQKERKNATI